MRTIIAIYKCRYCGGKHEEQIGDSIPSEMLPSVLNKNQFNIKPESNKVVTWMHPNNNYNNIPLIIVEECDGCNFGLSIFDLAKIKTKTIK